MNTPLTYPDVTSLAVPVFIAAILLELGWILFKKRGGRYETRDALTSLMMGAGNVATGLLLGFVTYGFLMWLWQLTPLDLGSSLAAVVLCFVLDDLRYYWVHRLGHRVRWVWASHVNHHSSQHYNLTTALRQTWTGTFTFMMIVRAPLILLGFHPACDILNRTDKALRLAINISDNTDEQVDPYLAAFFMAQLLFKLINSVVLLKRMYQYFKEPFVNAQVVERFMGEFLPGVAQ